MPRVSRDKARRSALKHLVETFFSGSEADAAAALLDPSASSLSREELDRIESLIVRAKKDNR
jgi:hypothetical protein